MNASLNTDILTKTFTAVGTTTATTSLGNSLTDVSSMTDFKNKVNNFDYGKDMTKDYNQKDLKVGNYLSIVS